MGGLEGPSAVPILVFGYSRLGCIVYPPRTRVFFFTRKSRLN